LARVQVGLVFRSQFRGVAPDPEVDLTLTGQPQALGFSEYVDTGPSDRAEVWRELAGPAPKRGQATPRQPRLSRTQPWVPGLI
jgi:hypothetical protein